MKQGANKAVKLMLRAASTRPVADSLTPSVTISAVTDPFSVQSGWANGADAPWIGHSAAVAAVDRKSVV